MLTIVHLRLAPRCCHESTFGFPPACLRCSFHSLLLSVCYSYGKVDSPHGEKCMRVIPAPSRPQCKTTTSASPRCFIPDLSSVLPLYCSAQHSINQAVQDSLPLLLSLLSRTPSAHVTLYSQIQQHCKQINTSNIYQCSWKRGSVIRVPGPRPARAISIYLGINPSV